MATDYGSSDVGTVYYRSKDTIKNLKIKVHLEKVTSTSLVPQAYIEQNVSDPTDHSSGTELREIRRQQELLSQREEEDCIFTWQDKFFCQREFDKYKHENSCVGVIEQKYHKIVVNMSERPNRRLFSYVNHDKPSNHREGVPKMTTAANEKTTPLAEKVAGVRRRRANASSIRIGDSGSGITPKINIVEAKPSDEFQRRNHVITTPEQTMLIMADLSMRDGEPTDKDEHVLCKIKVDANGVITMKPNFSQNSKPYRIETDSLGKEIYQYTLENVSKQMSNLEKKREEKMYKELYSRHNQYVASLVGTDFELPPPGVLRLVFYGEILSARNFEYDNLFIRYIVNVPPKDKGWMVDPESKIAGVTQTCTTKVDGRENVAYFSYPFDADLHYKVKISEADSTETIIASWPKIFFEVCSLDSWSRFRPEGYCAVVIPNISGEHTIKMNCWRPMGPSVVSTNLRRFFVGGAPELEDLSYTHIPTDFKGKRMSRYGFKTESTGSITVKLNVMLQSQSFSFSRKNKKSREGADNLMSQIGTATDYTQIKAVVDAFAKAHEKMRLARENVIQNIRELSLDDQMTFAADI